MDEKSRISIFISALKIEKWSKIGFIFASFIPVLNAIFEIKSEPLGIIFDPSLSDNWDVITFNMLAIATFLYFTYKEGLSLQNRENEMASISSFVKLTRNAICSEFNKLSMKFQDVIGDDESKIDWRITFYYALPAKDRFVMLARDSNKIEFKKKRKILYHPHKKSCIYRTWYTNKSDHFIDQYKGDINNLKKVKLWVEERGSVYSNLSMKSTNFFGKKISKILTHKKTSKPKAGVLIIECSNDPTYDLKSKFDSIWESPEMRNFREKLSSFTEKS